MPDPIPGKPESIMRGTLSRIPEDWHPNKRKPVNNQGWPEG